MDGRVPTFCVTVRGQSPAVAQPPSANLGFAVWHGNYYAVEVMNGSGCPRVQFASGSSTTTPRRRSTAYLEALAEL
jgi:hypothetical protein